MAATDTDMHTADLHMTDIELLLRSLDYDVLFRTDGWVECLVAGNGERWMGRGIDQASALRDVERQMFPSHAARAARLGSGTFLSGVSAPVLVAEGSPEPPPPDMPEETSDEAAPVEMAPVEMASPTETSPPEVVMETLPPEVVTAKLIDPDPAWSGTYVSPDGQPAQADEGAEPDMTKEEALEIVAGISDEITDGLDDVAVMTTLHQRLHIAAWIFRGRTVQENFSRDAQVEEAVHRIAVRLTGICKLYWPGSVRALQVHTTPTQALQGLVRTPETPRKWAEAAEIMETHIDEVESAKDHDEFGWRDRRQCIPEAPDPEAVLADAVSKIEAVMGSLDEPLDDKRTKVTGDHVISELETLVMAAHLLRWVRRSCSERHLWGTAIGALRWVSRQPRNAKDVEALRDLLLDTHCPTRPWAELLGRDPKINEKNRLRKQVMASPPRPDWLEEDLMAWLHKAFQAFTNPQIAKLTGDVHDQIMEFTTADFADADRNTRSRLRKLQVILGAQQDVTSVELPDVSEVEDVPEEPAARKGIDPAKVLLAKVQEITKGKRVLFVTNRDDERLRQDLERDLQCDVTLKDGGNPRTMQSVIRSVDRNKYDFVLMATGFNNHNADVSLCRAAKSEGIPYVRVQKGRLASTIRALGRAFNVSKERKAADETAIAHGG